MSDEEIQKSEGDSFKGFLHYAMWFIFWGAILSFLHVTSPEQRAVASFNQIKIWQALSGALWGLICAIFFTFAQNSLNKSRKRWLSWILVITTIFSVNVLTFLIFGDI